MSAIGSLDLFKLALQVIQLLNLPSHVVTSLLDLKFFLLKKLSLLINSVFDALQSDLPYDAQSFTLEDILSPLDSVAFYVGQQLLYEHSLIV